ncbi:MAG: tetratricopeptide repeat protein [Caldilineaceae bacterium]|nr:tetratricopeptide repeat protein [Caldilineaceae bacterium]MCB0095487.1 tetratricopeptide repeat protein [Caldilineaceae bacterium]MCB0142626.1 tetratricopeptide repeat protein [Caldilineaceae bacterium]
MVTTATQPPSLGRWLKRLRSQHDLTQEALAELANCSVQAIRFFESGRRRPSVEMAEHLAQILHVPDSEVERFIQTARAPLAERDEANGDESITLSSSPPASIPLAEPRQTAPLLQPANDLIGRQPEVNILTRLLVDERHRLVSLTGMGGMGKTRLALHLAHALHPHFADGVAFVPLASLTQVTEIPAAIASALDAPLPKEPTPLAQIDALLHGRTLLLVLDNFEHLIGAREQPAASAFDALEVVHHLVQRHGGLQLLITTRERLRLTGEQTFELGGLAVSPADAPNSLAENEAVLLFVQRAAQVAPNFTLTPANREAIWRICTLLEGAPLAIELAAAWIHVISPAEIADEITTDLDFLARGDRNLPDRHRSLRSLFEHSWVRLSAQEQRAVTGLALFRGGFTRAAARAVAAAPLALLAQLVDKSLVRVFMEQDTTGEKAPRYYIHNLLRVYLLEKLGTGAEATEAHRQHAIYYCGLAEQIEPTLYAGNSGAGLRQLNAEHANLRAVLQWTLAEQGDAQLGLQFVGALGRFWHLAMHWREGRDWLEQALSQQVPEQHLRNAEYVARAQLHLGTLYHALEEHERAVALLQQSLTLWRTLENARQSAWALFQLGAVTSSSGQYAAAEAYLAESLNLYQALNDRWALATVLNQLSAIASTRGDYARAGQLLDEALPILRQVQGTGSGVAVSLNLLGRIVLGQGDAPRAIALFQEALAITSQNQNREGEAWSLLNLGLAYLAVNNLAAAAQAFQADLAINQEMERKGGIMAALEGLAAVAAAQCKVQDARQLLEQAEKLRSEIGQPLTAYELDLHNRTVATIHGCAPLLKC